MLLVELEPRLVGLHELLHETKFLRDEQIVQVKRNEKLLTDSM